jgi:phosphomannomutase / phosphoglucomutase
MYSIVKPEKHIFRAYDIRGESGKDLDENIVYTLGRGYATFLSQRRIHKCVVGRDCRLTSQEFSHAFTTGLLDGGIDVVDIGLTLSQIVYFSAYYFKTRGTAIITASHNPKNFNGLKLGTGYSDTMVTEEIQYLSEIIESNIFSSGKGKLEELDIFSAYKNYVLSLYTVSSGKKIVVDGCNTGSGMIYADLLRSIGCQVIEQNCEIDGNFPLGQPDPSKVTVQQRMSDSVKKHKADMGIGYDTDGDRFSVVDDTGKALWTDSLVSLYAKDILESYKGAKIIFDSMCSQQVKKTIEKNGGIAIMWKTGHALIKSKLKQERAVFAGELSGHMFFADNFFGHDDGAVATLRLIDYLERKQQKLSEAISELPQYISTPAIYLNVPEESKSNLMGRLKIDIKIKFQGSGISELDGIRIDGDKGMAVLRPSNTNPQIALKLEASDQESFLKIKKDIKEVLLRFTEINIKDGINTELLDS